WVVIYTVLVLVIGFFIIPFMLMMLAILGIIIFLMPLLSYYLMVNHHVKIKETRGKLYEQSTDSLFGQLDWLVSGRVEEVTEHISHHNAQLMGRLTKINRWHTLRDFLLQLVVGVIVIAVMGWAHKQTGEGVFSPTMIAAFTLMMFAITDALMPISNAVEEVPTYDESLKRMNKLSATAVVEEKSQEWKLVRKPTLSVECVRYVYPNTNEVI